jgi:hypothetical protein
MGNVATPILHAVRLAADVNAQMNVNVAAHVPARIDRGELDDALLVAELDTSQEIGLVYSARPRTARRTSSECGAAGRRAKPIRWATRRWAWGTAAPLGRIK